MYVDDLIKELEEWKAPNFEVTANNNDIKRVTLSEHGHKLNILYDSESEDSELFYLKCQLQDTENCYSSVADELSDCRDWIEDFKEVVEKAIPYLKEQKNFLDGLDINSENISLLLDKCDYVLEESNYGY